MRNMFVALKGRFVNFLAALAILALPGLAMAESALPDLGTDPTGFLTEAGTEAGTILMTVFGIFIVLFVVGLAMRWIKKVRSGG